MGGILTIVGLLALLIAVGELAVRWAADRATARQLDRQRDELAGFGQLGDPVCPWLRFEPEVELLRRKGAL